MCVSEVEVEFSYFDGYECNYNILIPVATGEVIREISEYYANFEKLVHENGTYFGNMMVCDKKLYDEYAEWLFSIFTEVRKN